MNFMTLLCEFLIPPAVKRTEDKEFYQCSQLMIVKFGEGLNETEQEAFHKCTSLNEISIPPAVKVMQYLTFC